MSARSVRSILISILSYIHANYRFIVNPDGDYTAQTRNADVHLDWNSVLQILVSEKSQLTNCPICLSTPVVPRMAKCGHLFCLSCLIRYMHSSDNDNPTPEKKARWKKCPICWDSIYISETRPVRWFIGQEQDRPQEGGDIVLRLIKRQSSSTLALPRDGAEVLEKGEETPWFFAAEVMDYARIMRGGRGYMMDQYDAEIERLQRLEREDELMFGEDNQWTRKAVSSINEAKDRIEGIGNPPISTKSPPERQPRRAPIEYQDNKSDAPDFIDVQQAAKSGQSISRSPAPLRNETPGSSKSSARSPSAPKYRPEPFSRADTDNLRSASKTSIPIHGSSSLSRNGKSDSPFYFYEALLHYYLSPLDIRILKAAFDDYALFPSTILPQVEHVSTGHIVDDELRRRAKYLGHLPQGCEVAFLECNWTDIVPQHVLETFAADIDRRRRRNREKEVKEERERVRAEKEEDEKRWAAARRRKPIPASTSISDAELQPLSESLHHFEFGEASSSPPWPSARSQQGSAFATLASPSTSPATAKTVWGTRIVPSAAEPALDETQEHEPSENDGWLANWENDLAHEEIFSAHFEENSAEPAGSKPISGTGKKKKGKKITLMTTNGRRGA